jgi:hypothetical protein
MRSKASHYIMQLDWFFFYFGWINYQSIIALFALFFNWKILGSFFLSIRLLNCYSMIRRSQTLIVNCNLTLKDNGSQSFLLANVTKPTGRIMLLGWIHVW